MPLKIPPELGLFFAVGWSLTVWMAGGVLLGRLADSHLGSKPWGLVAGALLGMAGSGYSLYRIVQGSEKKD